MKKGFTLLEMLVATALLAMLVTILTMIFSQSSIAWTIGVASVTGLGDTRENMAIYADEAEHSIMPDSGSTPVKVVSVFADNGTGLRSEGRTLSTVYLRAKPTESEMTDDSSLPDGKPVSGASAAGRDTYIVGVTSFGPDGKEGTWDDITTLPEEVVK